VIGRFDTEQEAFAVESCLIKWSYGIGNLTNTVHGHHHEFIREISIFEEVPGLDIEKIISQNDGTYTNEQNSLSEKHNVEQKLNYIKHGLESRYEQLKVSTPDFKKPKDPSLYIPINDIAKLQLILRPSGTDVVIFTIRPISNNKENRVSFHEKYGEQYEIKGKNDLYFKYEDWKNSNPHYFDQIDIVVDRVGDVMRRENFN
jgi:hypothetical protein